MFLAGDAHLLWNRTARLHQPMLKITSGGGACEWVLLKTSCSSICCSGAGYSNGPRSKIARSEQKNGLRCLIPAKQEG